LQQVLLKRAEFGKLLKSVFPDIKTSRKGSRGQSQYCYNTLSWKDRTSSPVMPVQSSESQMSDGFRNLSQIFQYFKHRDPSKDSNYCVCGYDDNNNFMIACDFRLEGCKEWYHGECVGVTEDESKSIQTYKCPSCIIKQNESSVPAIGQFTVESSVPAMDQITVESSVPVTDAVIVESSLDSETIPCPECHQKFLTNRSLGAHIRLRHPKTYRGNKVEESISREAYSPKNDAPDNKTEESGTF